MLKEIGLKEVLVVMDKGFVRLLLLNELEKKSLKYVMPLKRSGAEYSLVPLELGFTS